jgi:hypothetical protein
VTLRNGFIFLGKMNSLNFENISRNYKAVVKAAIKLADSRNWPLKDTGECTIEATIKYLDFLHEKAKAGRIKVSSIKSYISALDAAHLNSNIKWKARSDFRVKFKIKRISKDKHIPQQFTKQNYEFTFEDLKELCEMLDPSIYEDIVIGALATCLFWSLGRVHELIHAEEHPRLTRRTIHKSPLGLWQILLERPKVITENVQILNPVESNGKTRANTWVSILMEEIPNGYISPWQLGTNRHADTNWFYRKIESKLGRRLKEIGPSSFRAGGLTHMASMGVPLDHLQLLGRWESDAWKRYLRNHPWVVARIIWN